MHPSTQPCSLTDPALSALAYSDKLRVRELARRIPENMHGLFRVLTSFDAEHGLQLMGLQMQPDPALRSMNALQTAGELRAPMFLHTSDSLADRMRFSVAEIDAMLAGTPGDIPPYYDDPSALGNSARGGMNYAGTFSLPNALRNPRLPATERVFLERVSNAVPSDLRGAFYCDLARIDGALQLARLTIDPLHTLSELNSTLFKPLAGKREGTWNHSELYTHPKITSSIDRAHLETAIAHIGTPGRSIA